MEPPPELGGEAPEDPAPRTSSDTTPPAGSATAEGPLIGTAEPLRAEPPQAVPEPAPPTTARPRGRARRMLAVTGLILLVLWAVSVPLVGAWWLERERSRADRLATESTELRAQVTELSSELSVLRAELGLLREELDALRDDVGASLDEGS
jgi:outer membrane murein-binding lipoprotein Lpp